MWLINEKTKKAVNSYAIISVSVDGNKLVADVTNKTDPIVLMEYDSSEDAIKAFERMVSTPGSMIRRTQVLLTSEDLATEDTSVEDDNDDADYEDEENEDS